jgi:hypothetical protein
MNSAHFTHEELLSLWEKDSPIDKLHLDNESVDIPLLHHKYLSIYMDLKAKKIAYTHKLEDLKKDKEIYYSGQATADVYKAQPFDLKLKTKGGVDKHVNTDPDVVKLSQRIEYMDILIEGCWHILEQIKWRGNNIKNAISFLKFQSGEL